MSDSAALHYSQGPRLTKLCPLVGKTNEVCGCFVLLWSNSTTPNVTAIVRYNYDRFVETWVMCQRIDPLTSDSVPLLFDDILQYTSTPATMSESESVDANGPASAKAIVQTHVCVHECTVREQIGVYDSQRCCQILRPRVKTRNRHLDRRCVRFPTVGTGLCQYR